MRTTFSSMNAIGLCFILLSACGQSGEHRAATQDLVVSTGTATENGLPAGTVICPQPSAERPTSTVTPSIPVPVTSSMSTK